jgi:hypothetical protein
LSRKTHIPLIHGADTRSNFPVVLSFRSLRYFWYKRSARDFRSQYGQEKLGEELLWGITEVAASLYGFLYLAVLSIQHGSIPRSPQDLLKSSSRSRHGLSSSESVGQSISLQVPLPKLNVAKINLNANWFNRPESLVVPRDDYMGKRPHIDTVANITKLVEECRGSYENIEKMPYVYDCLKYLEEGEKEYFNLPPKGERASEQPPRKAEYLNSDGENNILDRYPSHKAASKHSIGKCNGLSIPCLLDGTSNLASGAVCKEPLLHPEYSLCQIMDLARRGSRSWGCGEDAK